MICATISFEAIHSALNGTLPRSTHGLQSFVKGSGKRCAFVVVATSAALIKQKRNELDVNMMLLLMLLLLMLLLLLLFLIVLLVLIVAVLLKSLLLLFQLSVELNCETVCYCIKKIADVSVGKALFVPITI